LLHIVPMPKLTQVVSNLGSANLLPNRPAFGFVSASSRVPGGRLPRGSWDGSYSLSDLDPWFILFRTGLAPHGAAAFPNQSHCQRASRWSRFATPRSYPNRSTIREIVMTLTAEHLSPIVALIAGILILILPSLLNYVVAIYVIKSAPALSSQRGPYR
jgi:hypothetical protein